MTHDRLKNVDADLLATMRALFPGAQLTVGRGSEHDMPFRFVPGVRRTHMLVPARSPQAAAGAVDRPSASDSRRQTLKRRAVGAVLRSSGLAALIMPDVLMVGRSTDSILNHLSKAIGKDVQFSMALGSRRANRKPVLAVYSGDTEIGYAKIGLSSLANQLIDREAAVLHALSQTPTQHFQAPRVIHHGTWRASSVLLMESLRPQVRSRASHVPLDAIVEIARSGATGTQPLAGTEWLTRILLSGDELKQRGRPELSRIAGRYREVFGSVKAPLGRWHGDLGPWNMVWDNGTASIWDWERSELNVPGGIDSVHFTCHSSLRDVGNLPRARRVLTETGTAALRGAIRGLGADEMDDRLVRACLLGYLLSVSARFSGDAERPGGAMVRPLADWYLAVLMDQLTDME